MTSVPSRKVTPATTFGNWFSPFSLRQVFAAAITSLNTISLAVVGESAPLGRTGRGRPLGAPRPVPRRGEDALDGVCRPKVIPVLGGEVVEGQQRLAVLRQALNRSGVLAPILLGKDGHGRLGCRAGGRTMDLAQIRLHRPL